MSPTGFERSGLGDAADGDDVDAAIDAVGPEGSEVEPDPLLAQPATRTSVATSADVRIRIRSPPTRAIANRVGPLPVQTHERADAFDAARYAAAGICHSWSEARIPSRCPDHLDIRVVLPSTRPCRSGHGRADVRWGKVRSSAAPFAKPRQGEPAEVRSACRASPRR